MGRGRRRVGSADLRMELIPLDSSVKDYMATRFCDEVDLPHCNNPKFLPWCANTDADAVVSTVGAVGQKSSTGDKGDKGINNKDKGKGQGQLGQHKDKELQFSNKSYASLEHAHHEEQGAGL